MIWLWGLVVLSTIPFGSTYYHELSNKTFDVTKEQNVYFGYSIAYESTKKLLIISAPLSTYTGDIYICDIYKTTCNIMRTNTSDIDTRFNEEFEQNMWLGAVIKAAPTYFVTCAPLAISQSLYINLTGTYGQCFYGDVNDLTKLNKLNTTSYENKWKPLEHTADSFGWSIDIANKSTKSFIVGSPAMIQGRVEKYDGFENDPIFVNGSKYSMEFNFGYSVASGHFRTDGTNITFAVGSTYGSGKVVFIDNQLSEWSIDLIKGVDEDVIGSMYGAVLCTASFTGYQTDLLVGAPTYASRNAVNRGAVYVYTKNNKEVPEFTRKIVGETDKSYFGNAIVNVGDLNKDNKDEIAIGAPYENEGRGAVYIYSGADILQADTLVPLQRIEPETNGWMTFGHSLSALDDYDDNGCNELAIGAPASDKIMVLRCMASVLVEVVTKINQHNLQNWRKVKNNRDRNATHFILKSCLKVTYPDKPKNIRATIRMKVEVTHVDVKLADPKKAEYDIDLKTKEKEYCNIIPVFAPEKGKYSESIEVVINAKHIDDPIHHSDFDGSQVRLSDQSKTHSKIFVWAAECNNSCSPELKYVSTQLSTSENYLIGSTDTITATVVVKNTGDPAYDACLFLHLEGARFLQATESCTLKRGALLCTPKDLLRNGGQWKTDKLSIETKHLTSKDQRLLIQGTLYNNCLVNVSRMFNKTINLLRDYDGVTVTGVTNSGIDSFVNMTSTDIAIGKVFEHVYKIINHGTTTWKDIKFTVKVKKEVFIDIQSISHQLVGVSCTDMDTKTEKTFTCHVTELSKNMITVSVPIRVLPNSVGTLIEKQNLTVDSSMTLVLNIFEKHANVLSTLRLQEVVVPLWLYISTGIAGLLILILIFFILRELGCLRRKNKDRLVRIRQSVRHQTMMRERSRSQTSQSSNIRHERLNEMTTEEVQAALADAAKKKYDRRIKVKET